MLDDALFTKWGFRSSVEGSPGSLGDKGCGCERFSSPRRQCPTVDSIFRKIRIRNSGDDLAEFAEGLAMPWRKTDRAYGNISASAAEPLAESGLIHTSTSAGSAANSLRSFQIAKASGIRLNFTLFVSPGAIDTVWNPFRA